MTVDIYEDAKGEHRWRFLAANGKTIADSGEGYKRLKPLMRALSRIEDGLCFDKIKFKLNGKKLSRAAIWVEAEGR